MTNCPYCGKLTDPKLDGCPHCGGYLKKKVAAAKTVAPKKNQYCPSCRNIVQQGDIICVVCGTNLLTGQKVADAPDPESTSTGIPVAGIVVGIVTTISIVLGGIGVYMSNSDPLERARALIDDFNYPEARTLLQDYIKKDPDNEEAMFELAKLQWRAKEFGEAAVAFENVIEINPANVDAGLLAVLCLQLTGNTQTTTHEIPILEKISKNAERDARVWLILGMAKGARGEGEDYAEQIIALERVLELSPDLKTAHLDLGIAQALLGNYQRAKSELNQITSSEARGTALAFLGYVSALEQNPERAIGYFEDALKTEGLNIRWQAQTELAKLRIQSGQYLEAEKGLSSALQENPQNDTGRYLRGIALHSMSRANEALNEYETIVRGRGELVGAASVQAASIQLLLGNISGAERSMNNARKAGVESPSYYTVQGRLYVSLNLVRDAMESFDTAIRMEPAYAPTYLERGLLFVRQDKIEQGVRDLNNYLSLLGRTTRGTKANEIRLLTNQLQRTIEQKKS
jgi:tetratricopeptide (TPR) repeat protein